MTIDKQKPDTISAPDGQQSARAFRLPEGIRPSSLDVAAAAGVSQPTVSRALRGDPAVNAETRQRIVEIAEAMGYRTDRRASRLRSDDTGIVAVAILGPTATGRPLNPLFLDLVAAIDRAAAARGLGVLLSYQGRPERWRADFEHRREADALIVLGSAFEQEAWDYFALAHQGGVKIAGWGAPDDRVPTVRTDGHAGAKLAVDHLVATGRRAIAFVGPGWRTYLAYARRRAGYLDALRYHGLEPIEIDIDADPDRVSQGRAAVESLIARQISFDAIFAASDHLAIGVLDALHRHGLAIPGDVAVVGYDGGFGSQHCFPALTTVEQDVVEAGRLLVEAALPTATPPEPRPMVSVRLVVRESSVISG